MNTCITLVALLAITSLVRAVDTYNIDPMHTSVGFSIAHLVISEVNGRFNEFAGELTVDPALPTLVTGGTGTIQTKSIDTGVKKRDDHLRSPDFFDVEKFPTITFESLRVEANDGQPVFAGKFTMHGVTKAIRVPVTVKGPIKDPMGKTRIAFVAKTTLNRKDYGLTWNKALEAGGLMVGDEVTIEIKAEAIKQ